MTIQYTTTQRHDRIIADMFPYLGDDISKPQIGIFRCDKDDNDFFDGNIIDWN